MGSKVSIQARLLTGKSLISAIQPSVIEGRVTSVAGLAADVIGLASLASVGDRVSLDRHCGMRLTAEIVGFQEKTARVLAFDRLEGIGSGSVARLSIAADIHSQSAMLAPSTGWLGRVVDPVGRPLDDKGELPRGNHLRRSRADPPAALSRARLGARIDLGVKALNLFVTCRTGQRLGLFAGSGVGKSTLLAMLARNTDCDVAVLALVGERGREVREFIEDELGPDGLARSVVIAATSDSSPLMRREAAYMAMTVAEHFRDEGKSVLLLMDSVTRFCLALREIALSAGEPPATRGYPPSVFAEIPRLLERAGPGPYINGIAGQITALFTVLVEGDDHNEPIADAVRGILDGHVVLDRRIAESGRFPAIDILRSLSRTVPGCLLPVENDLVQRGRALLAIYSEMVDLVRLGAYRPGADAAVDEAVALAPRIEKLLHQDRARCHTHQECFADLATAVEPIQ